MTEGKSMTKNIVLFDMDGTLTEPRKTIEQPMIDALIELCGVTEVGIVTGSDIEYVFQQCGLLFENSRFDPSVFHLFPCNGTKVYKWNTKLKKYEKEYSVDMIGEIGQENYNKIIQTCLGYQLLISIQHDLPYTGTFFQYRDSMLNWCPIGRSAKDPARKQWCDEDLEHSIRNIFIDRMQSFFNESKMAVTIALGGSTSFDMFPDGWDKTFVINHVDGYTIKFVGDKCTGSGNDKALYDFLQPNNSYETKQPGTTIKLINTFIEELQ